MPYAIPDSASLEWLLDYVVGAEAALGALPITAPQAVPWTAFRATLRTARDKRDDDRFALKSASAIARVADAEWDRTLVALSGEAYHLAGKKADELPYAALFGGLKAQEATRLGAFKATAFGTALLHKVAVLEDARLASVASDFAAAQAQLAAATNARIAAKGRAQSHDAGRQLHPDALDELIAHSEVAILTAAPGRHDLLKAAFTVEKPNRQAQDEEAPPAP